MPSKPQNEQEELVLDNLDLLESHAEQIEQTLVDLVLGLKFYTKYKRHKLKATEKEEQITLDTGEQGWLYTQPPVPSLVRFAREQLKGRAAQKAQQQHPVTINIIHAVPGHENYNGNTINDQNQLPGGGVSHDPDPGASAGGPGAGGSFGKVSGAPEPGDPGLPDLLNHAGPSGKWHGLSGLDEMDDLLSDLDLDEDDGV